MTQTMPGYRKLFLVAIAMILLTSCSREALREQLGPDRLSKIKEEASENKKNNAVLGHNSSTAIEVKRRPTFNGEEGGAIKLVNVSLAEAAQNILGKILNIKYTTDTDLSRKITIQTTRSVSNSALLAAFRTIMESIGFGTVQQDNGHLRILPLNELEERHDFYLRRLGHITSERDSTVHLIAPVRYIEAANLMRVLQQFLSSEEATIFLNRSHNMLILSGKASIIAPVYHLITIFDSIELRNQNFSLVRVRTRRAEDMARILKENITASSTGFNSSDVQIIPNRELNAVVLISARQDILNNVEHQIAALDREVSVSSEQVYIYKVQNRSVDELAKIVKQIFLDVPDKSSDEKEEDGGAHKISNIASGKQVALTSGDGKETGTEKSGIRIVADKTNNALHIKAAPLIYREIVKVLQRLDVLPDQVQLEATIAEVSLNDDLKFGLRWYFQNNRHKASLANVLEDTASEAFPGFSYFFSTPKIQVALEALNSITDVNIISNPSLIVLNNEKAVLQVGDQVPVTTTSVDGDNDKVSMTSFRDTGVILSVRPRANDEGRIMLEISQEVSELRPQSSSLLPSSIQQRKIETKVLINDGASLTLGGLIQKGSRKNDSKVPLAGDVPIIGNAFKQKSDYINKTELLIIITPRIIKDPDKNLRATQELYRRMQRTNP